MRTFVAALAALLLAGCAGWGMMEPHDASSAAVRTALAAQRIEPAGKQDAPAPDGVDGRAAQAGYKRFEKSFSEQDKGTGKEEK